MRWGVDVELALRRPPRTDRHSRVLLEACCAHHAEIWAIETSVAVHGAVMAVGSTIVDWDE